MIKVYFTAATSFDGDLQKNYAEIISLAKNYPINLLSGEQIISKRLLDEDKKLAKRQIFERERKFIDQADCLIAEVSKPSLGVGAEIAYALNQQKPILALLQQGFEDRLSPIVAGNPSESLYIEYYNLDKLKFVIEDFLKHIDQSKQNKGKLIVIEGGDGSGKTTQALLLINFFKEKKLPLKYFDFPQYYHSFHGETVAKFLRGEFGAINQVSPYLSSLAYALDRASVKPEMESLLKKGAYLVANRYATSNIAHQGAKFNSKKAREEFFKWIYELEYKIHRIPKENLVIYLHVPWQISLKLSKKKVNRRYLQGQIKDIHEKDIAYRRQVEKTYLDLTKKFKHWVKIDCVQSGKLFSPIDIHQRLISVLKQKKIIANI